MKAVRIHKHGLPDVLQYCECPEPKLGSNEVLIEVRATSINHLDLFIRRGMPGVQIRLPLILGCDAAGVIREVGDTVSRFCSGDRVLINPSIRCGFCESCSDGYSNRCVRHVMVGQDIDGGYAQFVKVPAHVVLPIPDTLSFEEASAAPLVFLSAWSMLVRKGQIRPGEDVRKYMYRFDRSILDYKVSR